MKQLTTKQNTLLIFLSLFLMVIVSIIMSALVVYNA